MRALHIKRLSAQLTAMAAAAVMGIAAPFTGVSAMAADVSESAPELVLTAENAAAEVGESVPELTYIAEGLKDEDKLDELITLTHDAPVDAEGKLTQAGEYTIKIVLPEEESILDNYDIVCVEGVLTVTEPQSAPGGGGGDSPDADEPEPSPEPEYYVPVGPPEYIPTTENSSGWDEIKEEMCSLTKGAQLTVELNRACELPVDITRCIMELQLKVTFVIDDIKSWHINGAELADVTDIDLRVIEHSLLKRDVDITSFDGECVKRFSLNGTNAPADLTFKMGDSCANNAAYLYEYTDGRFVLTDVAVADSEGTFSYRLTESGEYFLVINDIMLLIEDVNGDGIVDDADAVTILINIVNHSENKMLFDIDRNHRVNALDAAEILRRIKFYRD